MIGMANGKIGETNNPDYTYLGETSKWFKGEYSYR